MTMHREGGFTLIELMVALTLAAVLTLLSLPSLTTFLTNTNIRTATESIHEGVRRAQVEALKQNTPIQFLLDPAVGWQVVDPNADDPKTSKPPKVIDSVVFVEGSRRAVVSATPAKSPGVTFSGLGRMLAKNVDGTDPLTQIDVSTALPGSHHDLRVMIVGTGGIKMCDPALPSDDPKGCPS
ncbi:MAG: GspH/FimT family pseudopilin [Betaproteobacteria bacterium]